MRPQPARVKLRRGLLPNILLLSFLSTCVLVWKDDVTSEQLSSETGGWRLQRSSLGDGCYHVFIDAGSNRGVHGRFLFEPHKYPKSKFALKFDEIFGPHRTKQNVCVFAFEPNVERHNASQMATQQAYQKMGWRYYYLPYGVSDHDGTEVFYRNLDYFNGLVREEWGFGTHLHGAQNNSQLASVTVIDFAKWLEFHVFERSIPLQNEFNRFEPRVALKMDVEGSEYRTLHHMRTTGTACKLDYIFGELHYQDYPQSFAGVTLKNQTDVERYAQQMLKELAKHGCPRFVEFDDEEYLHDGVIYPVPGEDSR